MGAMDFTAGALGVNAVRLAETAMASRGMTVLLRLPGMASSGDDAEQLGLGTPVFQDVPVGPAVWRKVGVDSALLLGASAVAALVGSGGYVSAKEMFESAAGVVVEGVMYTIAASAAIAAGDGPCGYRLTVVAPALV